MERSRKFCFTLNNYTSEEVEHLKTWDCLYLIFGKEVGESGTPHLQGYVSFAHPKQLKALKKLSDRAHWEIARGTPKQAAEYCEKDGDVFEKGERPLSQTEIGNAEKRRWADAFLAVKEDRIEDVPADIKCRNLKSIEYAVKRQKMCKRNLDTIDGELEHEWLVGETGCGKTSRAKAEHPGAYIKDPTTQWWDGYSGEDVVIIDDFDKFQVKQGGDMKRWLDRYAYQAQFKGGYELMRPRKIIVTSQYTPEEIWDDQRTVDAIMRRVKVIRVVSSGLAGAVATYSRSERNGSGALPPAIPILPSLILLQPPDPAGAQRHAGGAAEAPNGAANTTPRRGPPGSPGRLDFMVANGW